VNLRDFAARFGDRWESIFRKTFALRALVILGLFIWILAKHMGAWAGSSDASGYFNDARLLASGDLHPRQRTIEGLPPEKLEFMGYIPLGFKPRDDGRMYPTYAMGLPIMFVAGSKIWGWIAGPNIVMGLHALGCVAAMYFLSREFKLGREASLMTALMLGSGALFLFMSLQAMSDVPATLWAMLAVLCCVKSTQGPNWAVLSGLFYAYGILVRPTGVLMAVPLACLLPWRPKQILLFLLGTLPGIACIVALNSVLYGKAIATGYGDHSQFFRLQFIWPSFENYFRYIPVELTPLVFLVFAFPFIRHDLPLRLTSGLLSWVSIFFLFYATYSFTRETWWYLRFLLPAFPALIILLMHVLNRWALSCPKLRHVGWLALFLIDVSWNWHWTVKLTALDIGYGEKVYPETCDYILKTIPNSSVIFCMQESGAIFYYTEHPIVRWDCISADNFTAIESACAHARRRIYMVLFPFEEEEAVKRFRGATWKRMGTVRFVSVWELSAPDGS
jgi:hypothetical protein